MTYGIRGIVHYHGRKDASIQADIILEKKLGVLYLDPQAPEGDCVLHLLEPEHRRLQSLPRQCTLSPTRPYLLIVSLPMCQALKHMRQWVPFLLKPPPSLTFRTASHLGAYLGMFCLWEKGPKVTNFLLLCSYTFTLKTFIRV